MEREDILHSVQFAASSWPMLACVKISKVKSGVATNSSFAIGNTDHKYITMLITDE